MEKLETVQILELLKLIEEVQLEYPEWRKGQTFFNVLYNLYPEMADEIRGSEIDPFYINDNINKCLTYISKK
jgi:hypothetical protein